MLNSYGHYKVVTSIIGVLWNLIFFIILLYKVYCTSEAPTINTTVLSLLCGFFLTASLTLLVNALGVSLYNDWEYISNDNSASFLLLCIYDLGQTMTLLFGYTFYASQLYFTFENSALHIGKTIKYIHGFIISLIISITIAIFVIFVFIESTHYQIARSLILLIFTVITAATLHLIVLLNKRLFALVLTQRKMTYHLDLREKRKQTNIESQTNGSDEENENKKDIEMTERQLLLIKVITKLSALFGVFIPDGLVIVLFGIIAFTTQSIATDYMFWTVFSIGHMIGSLCFFLTLSLNEGIYIFLCGKCDRLCINICSNLAQKSMRHREEYGSDELNVEYWE